MSAERLDSILGLIERKLDRSATSRTVTALLKTKEQLVRSGVLTFSEGVKAEAAIRDAAVGIPMARKRAPRPVDSNALGAARANAAFLSGSAPSKPRRPSARPKPEARSPKSPPPKLASPSPTPFYFAYGSNMTESQMRSRVPDARKYGTAKLKGYEFIFSGYSSIWGGAVANVRRKTGSEVFGVVYLLPPGGLAQLDRYEGYPAIYRRKSVVVAMNPNGERISAVLYFKTRTVADAPPSPAYVKQILAALARHGAG